MTEIPAASASCTIIATSSSRKWPCRGSSRADSTPPLVATLITSAPARTNARTVFRISSGPSTIVFGRPGCGCSSCTVQPDGYQPSPWPPVWLSMLTAMSTRGPGISPVATASLTPRSDPPASRTVVMPRSSVVRRFRTASKYGYENGVCRVLSGCTPLNSRCTWQSTNPGSTVAPAQSTTSSPSSPGPTSTIRPSSTTTSAPAGGEPVPSKT